MVSMSIEASSDWSRAFLRFEEDADRIFLLRGQVYRQRTNIHDGTYKWVLLNCVLLNVVVG